MEGQNLTAFSGAPLLTMRPASAPDLEGATMTSVEASRRRLPVGSGSTRQGVSINGRDVDFRLFLLLSWRRSPRREKIDDG